MPTIIERVQAMQSEGSKLLIYLILAFKCTSPACTGMVHGVLSSPPFQDKLRTGEKAVVRFRFIKHPEYLKIGAKLLFREGVTKGIGHVTDLQAITTKENGLEESLGPGQLSF